MRIGRLVIMSIWRAVWSDWHWAWGAQSASPVSCKHHDHYVRDGWVSGVPRCRLQANQLSLDRCCICGREAWKYGLAEVFGAVEVPRPAGEKKGWWEDAA